MSDASHKDRAIRAENETVLTDIQKLARRVAKKALVKPERINQAVGRLRERDPGHHACSCDEKTASLIPRAIQQTRYRRTLERCYLLKTDRKDLTGNEIWRIYSLTTRAGDAFRDMKSPLVVRPVLPTPSIAGHSHQGSSLG